jgi:N-hydroxyarylamine O-acetyltransferase
VLDALLARIGLDQPPDADEEGLRVLHRAYLEHVPYEDIAVQLGETGPLDEGELAARVLADGRGGYCFELNTLLAALLRGCGFSVTHHQAVVGGEGPTNHMVLLVHLGGAVWIADAGLGEGFMEPLPLREGRFERGPLHYTLAREPEGTWWMGQHEWSSISGFRMQPSESVVADFEPHHRRLALEPESPFVRTLVVQSPRDDRIVTLRARTLSEIGPWVDTKRVLAREEFEPVLRAEFGISVGGERLQRLWSRAAAQHEAFMASVANTGH